MPRASPPLFPVPSRLPPAAAARREESGGFPLPGRPARRRAQPQVGAGAGGGAGRHRCYVTAGWWRGPPAAPRADEPQVQPPAGQRPAGAAGLAGRGGAEGHPERGGLRVWLGGGEAARRQRSRQRRRRGAQAALGGRWSRGSALATWGVEGDGKKIRRLSA